MRFLAEPSGDACPVGVLLRLDLSLKPEAHLPSAASVRLMELVGPVGAVGPKKDKSKGRKEPPFLEPR
jgi:hypothetical protein